MSQFMMSSIIEIKQMETVLIESSDNQVVIKIGRQHIEPTCLNESIQRFTTDLVQHQVSVNSSEIL